MPVRTTMVTAEVGLHARAAAVFVRAVIDSGQPVTIAKPGHPAVDARSLLAVMSQDYECGCAVELATPDEGDTAAAAEALDSLVRLLSSQSGKLKDPAGQE
ncbi:HPr family phosphocarrier protein [Arthrobacter castelli]|uniref:HPr family phosphocarrier protein n=1 Tax=Arthrobacter castelli TaxID=271431 RepID=UPI0004159AEF|nr:HPr family phosphocarrier protein [Arthrobacter castelli]